MRAPKARTEGLLSRELRDELLVYDLERNKAHCLSPSAALVWKSCDGRRTVAEIAARLRKEFNIPVAQEVVWLALEQLGKFQLLDEPPQLPARASRTSRRELVRKLGLTAAVSLPFVMSITVPTAAQAASCLANGTANCTSNTQCCGGCCARAKNNPTGTCANTSANLRGTGAACNNDKQCCSGNCVGTGGNKTCSA